MIKISINGAQILDTRRIETINHVEVIATGFATFMERNKARVLIKYLYDATQRCTGVIMFNNTIIDKKDVKEIKL